MDGGGASKYTSGVIGRPPSPAGGDPSPDTGRGSKENDGESGRPPFPAGDDPLPDTGRGKACSPPGSLQDFVCRSRVLGLLESSSGLLFCLLVRFGADNHVMWGPFLVVSGWQVTACSPPQPLGSLRDFVCRSLALGLLESPSGLLFCLLVRFGADYHVLWGPFLVVSGWQVTACSPPQPVLLLLTGDCVQSAAGLF